MPNEDSERQRQQNIENFNNIFYPQNRRRRGVHAPGGYARTPRFEDLPQATQRAIQHSPGSTIQNSQILGRLNRDARNPYAGSTIYSPGSQNQGDLQVARNRADYASGRTPNEFTQTLISVSGTPPISTANINASVPSASTNLVGGAGSTRAAINRDGGVGDDLRRGSGGGPGANLPLSSRPSRRRRGTEPCNIMIGAGPGDGGAGP